MNITFKHHGKPKFPSYQSALPENHRWPYVRFASLSYKPECSIWNKPEEKSYARDQNNVFQTQPCLYPKYLHKQNTLSVDTADTVVFKIRNFSTLPVCFTNEMVYWILCRRKRCLHKSMLFM